MSHMFQHAGEEGPEHVTVGGLTVGLAAGAGSGSVVGGVAGPCGAAPVKPAATLSDYSSLSDSGLCLGLGLAAAPCFGAEIKTHLNGFISVYIMYLSFSQFLIFTSTHPCLDGVNGSFCIVICASVIF